MESADALNRFRPDDSSRGELLEDGHEIVVKGEFKRAAKELGLAPPEIPVVRKLITDTDHFTLPQWLKFNLHDYFLNIDLHDYYWTNMRLHKHELLKF